MNAPAALLVVNERGVPQAPEAVTHRLRGLDPLLHLRCYRFGVVDQWAIVRDWEEHDARRARVKSGEIDPATALDILGYLPLDATPEAACALAERTLTAMEGGGYQYVAALLDRVRSHNQAVKDQTWQPTMDRANEAIETKASGLFAGEKGKIAKSAGGIGAGPKGKAKKEPSA